MKDQATQLRDLMERNTCTQEEVKRCRGEEVNARDDQFLPPPHPLTPSPPPQHCNAAVPASVLVGGAGAVSYGPICSVKQRSTAVSSPALRVGNYDRTPDSENRGTHRADVLRPIRLARAIAISSGKGGVGKSNLAINLAVAMSGLGLKVCLLDADLGLANADVLCNLAPKLTLEHVVAGRCRLAQSMMLAPGGFRLIPGASGVTRLADLGPASRQAILEQLAALERVADIILIDCGAGISANVVGFALAAGTVLVTTTPEPTSITDAYAMIKTLLMQAAARNHRRGAEERKEGLSTDDADNTDKHQVNQSAPSVKSVDVSRSNQVSSLRPGRLCGEDHARPRISVVVNMAAAEAQGAAVFARINRVSKTFLTGWGGGRDLEYGGTIPFDPAVPSAVRERVPFVLHSPDSPATQAVRRLAWRLVGWGASDRGGVGVEEPPMPGGRGPSQDARSMGFFARLALWLGVTEEIE